MKQAQISEKGVQFSSVVKRQLWGRVGGKVGGGGADGKGQGGVVGILSRKVYAD